MKKLSKPIKYLRILLFKFFEILVRSVSIKKAYNDTILISPRTTALAITKDMPDFIS